MDYKMRNDAIIMKDEFGKTQQMSRNISVEKRIGYLVLDRGSLSHSGRKRGIFFTATPSFVIGTTDLCH
jgi:hypothetical protein